MSNDDDDTKQQTTNPIITLYTFNGIVFFIYIITFLALLQAVYKKTPTKTTSSSSSNNPITTTPPSPIEKLITLTVTLTTLLQTIILNLQSGLWEQDVWWQIRAGDEILSHKRIQTVDTWSYTMHGVEWRNVWWMATVVLSLVYGTGGVGGLMVMKGWFVGVLMVVFAWGGRKEEEWLSYFLGSRVFLGVWAVLTCQFRIQIRPETMVVVLWAFVVMRRRRRRDDDGDDDDDFSYVCRRMCLALILTANMHYGLVVFGAFLTGATIAGEYGIRSRRTWKWATVATLCCFACPYPRYGWEFIVYHSIGYNKDKLLDNPDMKGLLLESNRIKIFYGVYVLLGTLSLAAFDQHSSEDEITTTTTKQRQRRNNQPWGYRVTWITFTAHWIFVGLSFERSRVVPFHVIYMSPLISHQFHLLCQKYGFVAHYIFLILALATINGHFPPSSSSTPSSSYDTINLGIAKGVKWPIHTTRHLNEIQPAGNVYHNFEFGNYLVYHADRYKVFGDTRETIFKPLESIYREAYHSPAALRELMATYDVNVVLTKIPDTELIYGKYYRDILEEYTPKEEWARVSFDDVSILLLRRGVVARNDDVIKQWEYEILKPHLPHDYYVKRDPRRSADMDGLFDDELDHCLTSFDGFVPVYCRLAKIAWDRDRGWGDDQRRIDDLVTMSHEVVTSWKLVWREGMHREYKSILDDYRKSIPRSRSARDDDWRGGSEL